MNKKYLFDSLRQQGPSTLLRLLESAFDTMTTDQRHEVFGGLKIDVNASQVGGKALLKEVQKFYDDSLKGVYYAPFDINSKNYMNIPEEFTEGAIPFLKRDSYQSLYNGVYKTAIEIATREQRKALESAIKKQKIRVK